MVFIDMQQIGHGGVLSGALSGRRAMGEIAARLSEPLQPTIIYLDYQGIEVATASFLRSAVFDFRDLLRSNQSRLYSVVANANQAVAEELGELTKYKNDALLACAANQDEPAHTFRLIGQLEPKQLLTFELVNRLRETDVSRIVEAAPLEEHIGKTAWNNRLSALETRGLIMEAKRGRTKVYRSICNGVIDGN